MCAGAKGDGPTAPATSTLVLPPHLRRQLALWVDAGYPAETCGLLIGKLDGERVLVERVAAARNQNRARARDRYDLDPADFVAADAAARADGLEVVGIWHSHPDHPALPSETDRAAAWEGWSYLILEATPEGAGAVRSWRLRGQRFVEENVSP